MSSLSQGAIFYVGYHVLGTHSDKIDMTLNLRGASEIKQIGNLPCPTLHGVISRYIIDKMSVIYEGWNIISIYFLMDSSKLIHPNMRYVFISHYLCQRWQNIVSYDGIPEDIVFKNIINRFHNRLQSMAPDDSYPFVVGIIRALVFVKAACNATLANDGLYLKMEVLIYKTS